MENRYLLATDTFDNKVFSLCVFDREKEQFVLSDVISGEKEFEKRIEELSKYYDTVPIKEVEVKPKTTNRIYAKVPNLNKAIVDYLKTDKGRGWLYEQGVIDMKLVDELLDFAQKNK
jgi:hypothetical protein